MSLIVSQLFNLQYESEYQCLNPDKAWLAKYSFATEGVALVTVAVVGICANFLSIAVLSHKAGNFVIAIIA